MTSPTIIVVRRSSRSAIAPASGPSSSAGSRVASHTPPTATAALPCDSDGASAVSAMMLSQSPRLDSERAIHNRRNGLIDSTPDLSWVLADRRARCPAPSCFGGARKFTG